LCETVREMERARIEVRLEEREKPTAVADRREVGGKLRRMVGVAVEHGHTSRLASLLEPPPGSTKLTQRCLGVGAQHPCELEHRERGRGVTPVVVARHRKVEI